MAPIPELQPSPEKPTGVVLRPWAESDALPLREAIDEDLAHLKPWLSWTFEEPATLEQTRRRLKHWVEQFRQGGSLRYAIAPLERPSTILGGAHLKLRAVPDALEVGYWVRRSASRRGVATTAVSALVVDAFDRRQAQRLVIRCDEANHGSAAFASALGFELVGGETTSYPDGRPRAVQRFEMPVRSYRLRHAERFRERARRAQLVPDGARWWGSPG